MTTAKLVQSLRSGDLIIVRAGVDAPQRLPAPAKVHGRSSDVEGKSRKMHKLLRELIAFRKAGKKK
jgi:hypothetical protein